MFLDDGYIAYRDLLMKGTRFFTKWVKQKINKSSKNLNFFTFIDNPLLQCKRDLQYF